MPHLYLVDGSGYIFRAYHRLPPLTNKHGEPVGAVYGYTTMLWKLADELHKAEGPTHMAVILDKSSSTFRNEMYDQYKAHRPPPPEDLKPQFPMIRDATRAFSLPCIEEEGWEADDLIASYAKAALAQGWQVTIVSSDKDLMQLIEPGLDMLDTMNNRRLDASHVVEKFGVPPSQLGEVLALMGDSVDNVPGVPGIGPKRAAELITEYGDVESVLAATDSMKKSKMRDNLVEHAEAARLSRKLVTLACDVPLPEPLDGLELQGIPDAPLRAFLEHHGFRTLLNRLSAVADPPAEAPVAPVDDDADAPCDHDAYETVVDEDALDRWIQVARHQGWVAIDTETTGLDATRAELVGISLALHPNLACYIPLGHGGQDLLAEVPQQLDRAVALAKLKPLLEDPTVLKIGHNLKYDMIVLARCGEGGIRVAPYDDTIVMSFDLDAGRHGHGMDELAATHLSHSCIAYKEVVGTGKNQRGFHEIDLKTATRYAAEDADVTLRLWRRFKPRLPYESATRVYEMVDRPLVQVLADMECRGVKVDAGALAKLSEEFSGQIAGLETEIHALAGGPFTIGSPKQLGDVLFDRLGLKGGRKGKSGVYSTDVNEMERLAADKDQPQGAEIAGKVLEWRQLTKLKNTYTDALQAQINPATGRVHTSYSLTGAQTGRLSSTDPNLQNIPIRTETGRQIRDAFVAEPGNVILAADYSQIELRLAAHIADVPQLREAFERGDDIHSLTATELFGEVNRDTRARAKTINFAILYGISRWGLAGRLDVSADEAQAMIDRYFERFPGINRYIAETLEGVKERGFTTTLFGRKTHFPRIKSKNQAERAGSERAAINAPIQGTSADIIKRAMARMEPALAEAGLPNVRMLMQVHDELVFELPEGDAEAARAVIERVMATAAEPVVTLTVPLAVEIGVGPSWGAAH
ncbi:MULTISPECIES: DNA polymerase I [Sphingomonas]|uniref:DNA polymerase I n=1 Tax=Sphingomonas TaxID=13687 RepID=UPI000F7E4B53|nr:DNA polymerase I [Sphingomonas sp. ABOLF]RSV16008.1 DNA polymerase I [Sphingomonas sp. ABOLF]RSV16011.1 DNA polymerase I [Sphingomonas sp. ABOLF]GLK20118.1 DNA polymerase I [Microbacterium terregens]